MKQIRQENELEDDYWDNSIRAMWAGQGEEEAIC